MLPMPNNSATAVRELPPLDPRVVRTTHALGRALVELIQEHDFDDITVQHILDRAGVGRATFYAHYRNKEDVLHSSYERMLVSMEALLDRPSPAGPRVFPVAEFLTHAGEMTALVRSLHSAGQMDEMWSLCVEYATRIIERRLSPTRSDARIPRPLAARMLAGALVESLQWWLDHPSSATPAQVDTAFHRLARGLTA